jgi:hypothetical protein
VGYDDEDSLRDTARAVEEYRRWETTGEHYFSALRPGLEPQIALADQMVTGLDGLLRHSDGYGIALGETMRHEVRALMEHYWRVPKDEGGPGPMNVEKWQR